MSSKMLLHVVIAPSVRPRRESISSHKQNLMNIDIRHLAALGLLQQWNSDHPISPSCRLEAGGLVDSAGCSQLPAILSTIHAMTI